LRGASLFALKSSALGMAAAGQGRAGDEGHTAAKVAASRENGRKGGRSKEAVTA
jgi:hypothetical protein